MFRIRRLQSDSKKYLIGVAKHPNPNPNRILVINVKQSWFVLLVFNWYVCRHFDKPWPTECFLCIRAVTVQRYHSGGGCTRISNTPQITEKTVIINWRKYGTTMALPRTRLPSKMNEKIRRKLLSEGGQDTGGKMKAFQEFLASTDCLVRTCEKNLPSFLYVGTMR